MSSDSVKALVSMFVGYLFISRKMALLLSLILHRTKLCCPYCGQKTINPGMSDYFIPTLGKYSCHKCGGSYRKPRLHGVIFLFSFCILTAIICFVVPSPYCYILFPAECLAITILGVVLYKPEKR